MKLNLKFIIFAVFLIVPFVAFGQGSGSSEGSKTSSEKMRKKSNFAINRSLSGTISSINASSISVRTSSGKTSVFVITKNTKFIGVRPKKGERSKVTYLVQNKQAVTIRRG
jgi:hypothetical protein